jgi:hypothetical protein
MKFRNIYIYVLIAPEDCILVESGGLKVSPITSRFKSDKSAKAHELLMQFNNGARTPEFSAQQADASVDVKPITGLHEDWRITFNCRWYMATSTRTM